ncbi:MAG TPA: S1 RNA-binding domain-containing protein [Thermodesulfobacteriota bacterium]|jgi:small subunit ribosomal protein S1|nr:S1 RNA-binding domain-containing protein [Thermodesulfobacteriota bacterium]
MAEKDMNGEPSFEELLRASSEAPGRRLFPGDKVSGKVLKISKDTIFIDLGGKSEGIAELQEFLDKEGNLTVEQGDWVEMRVASTRDGIHLTKGMKVQGADSLEMLLDAKENLIPVEGRVAGVVKGGFEVNLSGVRAFCPISQIDLQFCEKPEEHVGAKYPFRIMEIKEKGKNIIVSRRGFLEEEREEKSKETLARLKPGLECEGRVTKLTDFGAFVDIGGIEGMVHISEISHARIRHPSEVLKPGQQVKVKVMKFETDKDGRSKISLSIKALEPDAWEKGLGFEEGEIVHGKVSRLTDFGAFVEVAPGLDGLVHISEISYDHVSHPSRLLHEGDAVDVLVMGIDRQTHRISLSIREATVKKRMEEEGSDKARLEVGQVLRGIVEDSKPYGIFVRLPQLGPKVRGLLPVEEMKDSRKGDVKKKFPKGQEIQVEIISVDAQGKIRLSQRVMEEREDRESYRKFLEEDEKDGKLGTLGDIFNNLKLK